MRVLAVLSVYPPAHRFGSPLATHSYLRHLVDRGHQVTVGRTMGRGQGWEFDGVTVAATHGLSTVAALARSADVVLFHAGNESAKAVAADAAATVAFVHGIVDTANADLVVFNSEHLRRATPHCGQSVVCRPVVDTSAHRVSEIGDEITLINLTPDKGVATAWKIAERSPTRRFLGVRGGYNRSSERIPRCPNWTTLPTQTDMRNVWRRTRVLLMPSAFESWGMVGVEAMASGIPVIAHPTPGLLESLADAGMFIDRDDVDAWVDELERLDDPSEYAAARDAARQRFDELDPQADLDRFATALEALA